MCIISHLDKLYPVLILCAVIAAAYYGRCPALTKQLYNIIISFAYYNSNCGKAKKSAPITAFLFNMA
jgi:hypothetical protein